jgi:hypothetical protein
VGTKTVAEPMSPAVTHTNANLRISSLPNSRSIITCGETR